MAQQKASNIKWLENELKRWVESGIIDQCRADTIRGLYPEQQLHPWSIILFSGIGAVIAGLGIVLMFAYNWHDMTKTAKLSVIFISLVLSHSIGLSIFLKSSKFVLVGEAITVLGTMIFGSGIWLVAQIYHIEEHYPTAFMFWGFGALAMAFVMPSVVQAIIATILFTIWTGAEAADFVTAAHWSVLVMLTLWIFAYIKRSNILLCFLVVCSGFVIGFTSSCSEGTAVFASLFGLTVTYIAIGYISRFYGGYQQSSKIFSLFGRISYFVLLYILTFPQIDLYKEGLPFGVYTAYWLLPAAAAIAGWVVVVRMKISGRIDFPFDFWLMPLTLLLFFYQSVYFKVFDKWHLGAILFNLVFLAHTAGIMAGGCRDAKLTQTVIGSLMLAALTHARYFDLFDNLALRGAAFVAVGAVLFLQGFFYAKAKKKQNREIVR